MQLIWQSATATLAVEQLHPCTLDNQFCLVHHPDLAQVNQSLFAKLQGLAANYGWHLKKDQRRTDGESDFPDRRRRAWIPILLLSICCTSPTSAESSFNLQLKALPAPSLVTPAPAQHQLSSVSDKISVQADSYWSVKISQILEAHWLPTELDPPELQQDLLRMAQYYSQFPDARELLLRLDKSQWSLKYSKQNYSTDIVGKLFKIESVTVHFDPGSAAQFKFQRTCSKQVPVCISSPADVLLHELIHADLALNQTELFLQQGGLSSHIYPYAHERHTIQLERLLYHAMTEIDQLPRPLRSEHVGKHVAVSCATCLPQFSSR